jgi:hypothetical protein
MQQYKKSLNGKHFKALSQTAIFHLHDLTTPEMFRLVNAAGSLGAMLWVPEIDAMETYLVSVAALAHGFLLMNIQADLKVVIANVQDAFIDVDPSKSLSKYKIHLTGHIPDDIRTFGPAVRSSVEAFESHNKVFRACAVLSNRQAVSRDAGRKLASMECTKHLLSGGYYYSEALKAWIQAGTAARALLQEHPLLQRYLGWSASPDILPGKLSNKHF